MIFYAIDVSGETVIGGHATAVPMPGEQVRHGDKVYVVEQRRWSTGEQFLASGGDDFKAKADELGIDENTIAFVVFECREVERNKHG